MIEVYIGLGSNLAEPEKQLLAACKSLDELPNTTLIMRSSLYQSRPMGPQDQPNYVNAVVLIRTTLAAMTLLQHTQAIENRQGRVRVEKKWGPRTLDLDILLYGQEQIHNQQLTVPHPGLKQREFVLYPMFEISPSLILPCTEKLSDLVKTCPENGLKKLAG